MPVTGVRRVVRVLAGAALSVAVGVAVNQILSEGEFSWTWAYVSLGLAVLMLLYSEVGIAPAAVTPESADGGLRVYLRQLRLSVRDMETVGVATPNQFVLRTRQVYVDVSLVPQALHTTAGEPYLGAAPEAGRAPGEGRRRSLRSVLEDAEHDLVARVLAVIGGPGSGKTTLARYTALALCERRRHPRSRRLPVLLYLREHAEALLADTPPGLAGVAVSAGWLEGKVSAGWLERRLDRGGCVVLLDGLDEVADPADRTRVVSWITRQTQRHPRNVYVVTSRPHGYLTNPLPGAEVLQVRRFTGEQISRFLHQWSYATERRAREGHDHEVRAEAQRSAENLLARLRERPALYDLAANPLLLTMTANVHRYRGQLPGSRAELYAEMCDVLLHRRAEARGLHDATGLSGPHKQHVVQRLALAMMEARVRDVPLAEACALVRDPLRQVPGHVDPEVFLREATKSGLLVEREQGVHAFAHLTLQEYLAAAQLGTPGANAGLLTGQVTDPWWRETILLWAAANDAGDVITACLRDGSVPALALAFDCADQAQIIAPAVRRELEATLDLTGSSGRSDGPRVRRVLAGVRATRFLREEIRLDEARSLSARPIPPGLYDLFVGDERAAGRHHPGSTPSDLPVVGVQAGDADRFVRWLNDITGGDTVYRLPTPAELEDPAAALAADLTRHTVWAHDGSRTVLHQPPGVPWPYTLGEEGVGRVVSSDRARLNPHLWLLLAPRDEREDVVSWAELIAVAVRDAGQDAPPALHARLVVVRCLAFLLDHARTLVVGLGESRTRSAKDVEVAAVIRSMDTALALVTGCADLRGSEAERNIRVAHGVTVDAFPSLLRGGTDGVVVRNVVVLIGHAQSVVVDEDTHLSSQLGVQRALETGYTVALSRALAEARMRGAGGAAGWEFDASLSLRNPGVPGLTNGLVEALDHELRPESTHVSRTEPALERAVLLSLALDCAEAVSVALLGLHLVVLGLWGPARGVELPALEAAYRRIAEEPPPGRRNPQDPAEELANIRMLRTGFDRPRPDRLLLRRTRALLFAVRDRTVKPTGCTLAALRMTLLALTHTARQAGEVLDATSLRLAWESLATVDSGNDNQVLLIVSARQ
ncbi:NACHT domain-containing protein [Streptomyces longwoodensis]|uniref:NACHT domain-containing protein n=1 Tax=Streptomyces longwoodensis TaxID=68231 RepID=UPI0037A50E9C